MSSARLQMSSASVSFHEILFPPHNGFHSYQRQKIYQYQPPLFGGDAESRLPFLGRDWGHSEINTSPMFDGCREQMSLIAVSRRWMSQSESRLLTLVLGSQRTAVIFLQFRRASACTHPCPSIPLSSMTKEICILFTLTHFPRTQPHSP